MLISIDKCHFFSGGENGIRTHERITPLHAFQACAFNHSATSPKYFISLRYIKKTFFKCFDQFMIIFRNI